MIMLVPRSLVLISKCLLCSPGSQLPKSVSVHLISILTVKNEYEQLSAFTAVACEILVVAVKLLEAIAYDAMIRLDAYSIRGS
jgi:hypothetical protein